MRSLQRPVLGLLLGVLDEDAAAGRVAGEGLVVLAGAPPGLITTIPGVFGSDDSGELHQPAALPGGLLDPWPQPTRPDRVGLSGVADLDHPRARDRRRLKQPRLLTR